MYTMYIAYAFPTTEEETGRCQRKSEFGYNVITVDHAGLAAP
jgi:hypothetical protein